MQPKTMDKDVVKQVENKDQKKDLQKRKEEDKINSLNQGLNKDTHKDSHTQSIKALQITGDKLTQQIQRQKSLNNNSLNHQTGQSKPQSNQTQNVKNEQQFSQQKDQQKKQFQLIFDNYILTFSLSNQSVSNTGEQQLNRNYLSQTFIYDKFTQQMKALFENVNELWSILESSQENLQFEEKKLYFKIKLGGKDKKISIPLIQKQYTDPQYIQKVQQVARKYMQLIKKYQSQLNINKKVNKIDIKGLEIKRHFTKPTDFILDSERSHATNKSWPQPDNFNQKGQQTDDPIILFDILLERLNSMRNNFTELCEEIDTKIKNKSDPKLIKVKLLYLEQRKKSFQQQLQGQRLKFIDFQCKNDIYLQIDDLIKFFKTKYSELDRKTNRLSK